MARERVTFIISARDRTRAVLRAIGRGVRRLRLGFLSLGASVAAAFSVRQAFGLAKQLDSTSRILDVSVTRLRAFKVLAESIGQPFESLQDNLRQLQTNIGQALEGNERLAGGFEDIGISFADLENRSVLGIVEQLADAAQGLEGADLKRFQAQLRALGGETFVNLTALLTQGGDALRQQLDEIEARGPSAQGIQDLAARQRAAERAAAELQGLFAEVLVRAIPALLAFARSARELVNSLNARRIDERARETATTIRRNATNFAVSPLGAVVQGLQRFLDREPQGTITGRAGRRQNQDVVNAIVQQTRSFEDAIARQDRTGVVGP